MELEETHKNNKENVGKHARTHKLSTIRHVGLVAHVIKQMNRWSRPGRFFSLLRKIHTRKEWRTCRCPDV